MFEHFHDLLVLLVGKLSLLGFIHERRSMIYKTPERLVYISIAQEIVLQITHTSL